MDIEGEVKSEDVIGILSQALFSLLREKGEKPEEENEGVFVEYSGFCFIVYRQNDQIKIQYINKENVPEGIKSGTKIWTHDE